MKLSIGAMRNDIQRRRKSDQPQKSFQSKAYEIFHAMSHPFDAHEYLTRRLARWHKAWSFFPEPSVLAKRAVKMLRTEFKRPPPCILSAVAKTLLNGWTTARRFQKSAHGHVKLDAKTVMIVLSTMQLALKSIRHGSTSLGCHRPTGHWEFYVSPKNTAM